MHDLTRQPYLICCAKGRATAPLMHMQNERLARQALAVITT